MSEKKEKIPRMRKVMADYLKYSVNEYPHIHGFMDVDMTNLLQMKKRMEVEGVKVTMIAFFSKAVALTLMEFPKMNVRIENDEFIYYDTVNVGVAVNSPIGLFVPVLRDVQSKKLVEISDELKILKDKLANNTITMDDLKGGNITISSISGGRFNAFTSILNNHESLIVGFARTEKRVVVDEDDNMVIRPISTLCINANHFSTDGVPASNFGERLCQILEEPETFL